MPPQRDARAPDFRQAWWCRLDAAEQASARRCLSRIRSGGRPAPGAGRMSKPGRQVAGPVAAGSAAADARAGMSCGKEGTGKTIAPEAEPAAHLNDHSMTPADQNPSCKVAGALFLIGKIQMLGEVR